MCRKNLLAIILTALLIISAGYSYIDNDISIVKKIDTKEKVIALTFDDGPHVGTTLELLNVLKEKNIKATFFVMGKNVEANPMLFSETVAAGHEIGNHTYTHTFLRDTNYDNYIKDIMKAQDMLIAKGVTPVLFRPPGGGYNEHSLKRVSELGLRSIFWTIDTHDWARVSVNQVVDTVLKHIKPGSIILLHDGQPNLPTVKAVRILVNTLHKEGYRFVTVSELLQYAPIIN